MQNNTLFRYSELNDIAGLMEVIDTNETIIKEKSSTILLERIQQKQIISAVHENKIIGFIGWSKNYNNNNQAWFIEQITIHRDYRRQGAGLKLLQYFLNICTLENVHTVYATIQKDNEKSLSMFKKTDGAIVGETEGKYIFRITLV